MISYESNISNNTAEFSSLSKQNLSQYNNNFINNNKNFNKNPQNFNNKQKRRSNSISNVRIFKNLYEPIQPSYSEISILKAGTDSGISSDIQENETYPQRNLVLDIPEINKTENNLFLNDNLSLKEIEMRLEKISYEICDLKSSKNYI